MNSLQSLSGRLIVIEGIDQAGKRTVCERLVAELRGVGVATESSGFPDYTTPLGREIGRFLASQRNYPAEVRQLLYTANRWERAAEIRDWLAAGRAVVLDRYVASGIAYGTAQGLDHAWTMSIESGLPAPDLTILLDVTPDVSIARKAANRDAYEVRADLLALARQAYHDLARDPSWRVVDGGAECLSVWAAVLAVVQRFAAGQ